MKKFQLPTILIILLLSFGLVACGGETTTEPEPEPTTSSSNNSNETTNDRSEIITLVENPWPASELNVAVAKILLEQQLNYENVEIVGLDENLQWDALASGDVDASLEVWPSGHSERISEYIETQGIVEDGGPLGPEGVIGWYVPAYVVEQHPELATWEGFQDVELARMFATAETGEKGRFLSGDPSWVQYDEQIIQNLNLPLQVVLAGSEDALLAEVSSAIAREEPVLFYFYTPHDVFTRFDLVQVELPAYTEKCYANEDDIACAYPPDVLMKILSPSLKEKAPDAYTLLRNFHYSTGDQVSMLGALYADKTVEEAAQEWVDNNQSTWETWLP